MIAVPDALKDLLLEQRAHRCFDLWTIVLPSGGTIRWTSADIDLEVDGSVYKSEIAISRDRLTLTTGLETATVRMTISPNAAEPEIAGVPMRQAVRGGLFDGAKVTLDWAYYDLAYPPGLISMFQRFAGNVGAIDCFSSKSVLSINSPLKRLDLEIPWKTYGAECRFILGDGDCQADLTALSQSGEVEAGSTNGVIATSIAADDGSWISGTFTLTTSAGALFRRSVRTNVGGTLYLKTPLPWAPAAGEAVTVTPGCDKSKTATGCQKFHGGNWQTFFGGHPYIPSPETAY